MLLLEHPESLCRRLVERVLIDGLFPGIDRVGILAQLVAGIAEVLGRSTGATREYLSQCRKKLRPFLEETFSDASLNHTRFFARSPVQNLWRGFLANNDTREWSRVWSLAVLIAFVYRSRWPAVVHVMLAVVLAFVITDHVAKPFFNRARPFESYADSRVYGYRPTTRSFPSGPADLSLKRPGQKAMRITA